APRREALAAFPESNPAHARMRQLEGQLVEARRGVAAAQERAAWARQKADDALFNGQDPGPAEAEQRIAAQDKADMPRRVSVLAEWLADVRDQAQRELAAFRSTLQRELAAERHKMGEAVFQSVAETFVAGLANLAACDVLSMQLD